MVQQILQKQTMSGDEASLQSSERASILEGESIPEEHQFLRELLLLREYLFERETLCQWNLQTQPKIFCLRMVKHGMTPDTKTKSWQTKQRVYTISRVE